MSNSNLKAAPVNSTAIKLELDAARARPSTDRLGLGTAEDYRAQAAEYDSIAETEMLSWPSRVRLARAAAALRIAADAM